MFSFSGCLIFLGVVAVVGYLDNWRRTRGGEGLPMRKVAALIVILGVLSFVFFPALGRSYRYFEWSLTFYFYDWWWGVTVAMGLALLAGATVVLLRD